MRLLNLFKKNKRKKIEVADKVQSTENRNPIKENDLGINHGYLKPLPNGLLPGEVVLLYWIKGKAIDSGFPGYFKYTYGIDPSASTTKLLNEGYLREATKNESLSALKVADLKKMLKSKGLKLTGLKKDLIERVRENFTTAEIKSFITSIVVYTTDKGECVLEEYYYIVPAHQHDSKDGIYCVATAIDYFNRVDHQPNNDEIAWNLFNEAYESYLSKNQYGLARNALHNMALQLYREENFKKAFHYYLMVFISDLSGMGNSLYLDPPSLQFAAPGIVSKIKHIIEQNDYIDSELREVFNSAWEEMRSILPFHYLDEDSCFNCLLAALDGRDTFIEKKIKQAFDLLDKDIFEKKYNIKFPVSLEFKD